jgi:hypothetical protein
MELYFRSRVRLYVVHTEYFAVYLITVPEYVNMSLVTGRIRVEAMFVIINCVRNV